MHLRITIGIYFILGLSFGLSAQVSLGGVAKCMNGKPFPGVVVKLENLRSKTATYAISGDQGEYSFCNVDSTQNYRISASFNDALRPPEAGINIIDLELIRGFVERREEIPGLGFFAANFSDREYGVDARDLSSLRAFLLDNFRATDRNRIAPKWLVLMNQPNLYYPVAVDNFKALRDQADLNWVVIKTGDVDGSYCR